MTKVWMDSLLPLVTPPPPKENKLIILSGQFYQYKEKRDFQFDFSVL